MKKKKVAIIGATGMLGYNIFDVLRNNHDLVLSVRDNTKRKLLIRKQPESKKHKIIFLELKSVFSNFQKKRKSEGNLLANLTKELENVDYVINAAGLVIAPSNDNPNLALFINGAFPHLLSQIFGPKLIHITTDCVFNGLNGFPYDENSIKTPTNFYSLSKLMGEPNSCLTLRTSIIGRELESFTGLLEWFLKQKGKMINGYANHYWNGITAKEFGIVCHKIISNPTKFPRSGIYHIFSNSLSKYEMLMKFREKYGIDCEIRIDKSNKLNRTLTTIYDLNKKLNIPPFDQMLEDI